MGIYTNIGISCFEYCLGHNIDRQLFIPGEHEVVNDNVCNRQHISGYISSKMRGHPDLFRYSLVYILYSAIRQILMGGVDQLRMVCCYI